MHKTTLLFNLKLILLLKSEQHIIIFQRLILLFTKTKSRVGASFPILISL